MLHGVSNYYYYYFNMIAVIYCSDCATCWKVWGLNSHRNKVFAFFQDVRVDSGAHEAFI